jgi:hypothetical protein
MLILSVCPIAGFECYISQIARDTNIPGNVFPAGAARSDISSVPVCTKNKSNSNAIAHVSLASPLILSSGCDVR